MVVSSSVRAFRARFADVEDADRTDAALPTPDERIAESLALHGLALWMDLERAMRERGATRPEEVVEDVNRRRLASSPMPPSLAERARRRSTP